VTFVIFDTLIVSNIFTRNRCTTRQRTVCYTVPLKDQQYHEMPTIWTTQFALRRRFCDLLLLWTYACNIKTASQCLNNLQVWADKIGFRFFESRTVCVNFWPRHSSHSHPELILNEKSIPVVEETKFLGVNFDRKLTFISHMKYLRDKCTKAMNLVNVVKLHRSHIRLKLDYWCNIYESALPSYLKSLDCVQNLALRICLWAFRTSPSSSLHIEANEMPLYLRRERLTIQYMLKIRSTPVNPVYDCIFKPSYNVLFEKKPHAIAPLGIRIKQHLCDIGINLKHITVQRLPSISLWCLKDFELWLAITQ